MADIIAKLEFDYPCQAKRHSSLAESEGPAVRFRGHSDRAPGWELGLADLRRLRRQPAARIERRVLPCSVIAEPSMQNSQNKIAKTSTVQTQTEQDQPSQTKRSPIFISKLKECCPFFGNI